MVNTFEGVDEIFNSAGIQLAPLGFGLSQDWEVIERIEVTSAQATVDLDLNATGFDPTLYDEYELSILRLTNTSDGQLNLQVSIDGGATYEAGVSDYAWMKQRYDMVIAPTAALVGDDADTSMRIVDNLGNVAGEVCDAKVFIGDLDSSELKMFQTRFTARLQDGIEHGGWSNSTYFGSSAVNGLRLSVSAGNIDAGIFVLRGRLRIAASLISQDDWVVLSEKEASASANISFEPADFNNSQYDEFEIDIIDAVGASDGADLRLTVSDDGGATYEATLYHYANNRFGSVTTVTSVTATTSGTHGQLARVIGAGAGEAFNFTVKVKALDQATNYKVFEFIGTAWASIATEIVRWYGTVAWRGATNAINGIRFTMDNAGAQNIASGKFRLRGRRKTPIGVLKQDWEIIQHTKLTGNQATIEFIDIPSNEFDEFELSVTDVGSDTSAQFMGLQFSSDNGATWKAGASDYQTTHINLAAEVSTATVVQDNTASEIKLSANFDSTSVRKLHGTVRMGTFIGGSRKNVRQHMSALNDSGNGRAQVGAGWWVGTDSDGDTTAFRLMLIAGGNYTAGSTFTLRGRRKS